MNRDRFLFPWRWQPFDLCLAVFVLNPLMVLLLRVWIEGEFYWTRWKSFQIGDTVCLPLFAYFASRVIGGRTSQEDHENTSSTWAQLAFFFGGALLFAGPQVMHVLTEENYSEVFFLASEFWHTFFVSLLLPYVMLWGFFSAIGARKSAPWWVFALAMVFAAGYATTIVYDNFLPWQDRSPVTADNR